MPYKRQSVQLSDLKLIFAILLCLALLPFAQAQVIPADDHDLERIIQEVQPYRDMANFCSEESCPEFNCAEAQAAFIRLRDARKFLEYNHYWWKRAAKTHKDHFDRIAEEGILTGEEIRRVQDLLAYQKWVVDTASIALDLATGSGGLRELARDPKKLDEMSRRELLDQLDGFYESMKDLEAAQLELRKGLAPDAPDREAFLSLSNEDLDNFKSTASDLKTVVQEAIKNGRDWKGAFKSSNGRAAIGAIIGRVMKEYAKSEIEARQRRINDMQRNLAASDKVQAGLFIEFQRVQERRNRAEDAYRAVSDLIVVDRDSEKPTLTACFMKNRGKCGQMDLNYVSAIQFDDKYKFGHYNILEDLDGRQRNWAEATKYFTGQLDNVSVLLRESPPMFERAYSSVSVAEAVYSPGDTIEASFTAPSCYSTAAWAGIVPADVEHGYERINSQNALPGRSFIRNRREGILTFEAPAEAGRYTIRLNDPGAGTEGASATFTVEAESVASHPMEGVWESSVGNVWAIRVRDNKIVWREKLGGDWSEERPGELTGNRAETRWPPQRYSCKGRRGLIEYPLRFTVDAAGTTLAVEQKMLDPGACSQGNVAWTGWIPGLMVSSLSKVSEEYPD